MNVELYAVRDAKAGAFSAFHALPTRGEAIRAFGDFASDKSSNIGRHPADYSLWVVGVIDTSTGVVSPVTVVRLIGADEF